MTCPGPKAKRSPAAPSRPVDGLPSAFTLKFRRTSTGFTVTGPNVSASGPDAESAARDALVALTARGGGS